MYLKEPDIYTQFVYNKLSYSIAMNWKLISNQCSCTTKRSGQASAGEHLRFSKIKPFLCDDNNNDEHAKLDLLYIRL